MGEVRVQRRSETWSPSAAEASLRDEGLAPFRWSNTAGYHYAPHRHDYDSVIVCIAGSIRFQVDDADLELRPGDLLDLPAGVEHAATVGDDGVECLEGTR
jgi:mannose-6-phosphate isomerase-like protein (cupin superfamily)